MRLIDADALNLDYEVDMADDWKTAHEIANHIRYAPTVEAIPIEFIDQQIEHYRQLFEESLYRNDDYDEKARMMVDALNLLKRRWKEHEKRSS